jgi:hypothetical protein
MSIVRRIQNLEASALCVRVAPVEPLPLEQPSDVLAVLAEQVNAVREDALADPVEKARTLGFLASVALRVMEARDLDARLEAVERVLKLRREAERKQKGSR